MSTLELKGSFGTFINIGGYEVQIIEVKDYMRDYGKYGEWCPNSLKIFIDADLPETLKNQTKIHEILHAIMCLYDIRIKHHKIEILGVVLNQLLTGDNFK